MKRFLPLLILFGLALFPLQAQSPDWWRDATWYLLFVRSFYDSDGDGVGDLRGVIEKLDYLESLGIGGLWLMPVNSAASYHGYDALDYYAVEPDYGTKDDFNALIEAAHARGLRVIVDLVLNHTSSQHPWFLASARGDEAYADWYVWADQNPNYAGPWGQVAWHRKGSRFYYGAFWSGMPDLNYANPAVTATMYDVARYWLEEMRVDGFRLDAIKYVVESETNGVRLLKNAPANRQWLTAFNDHVKSINPNAFVIGEVWDATIAAERYVREDSVDMVFEFDLAQEFLNAARTGRAEPLIRMLRNVLRAYPDDRFAPFLTNHDLPRVMSQVGGDESIAKLAASLLLTSPGAPFIYYGEEIGMSGSKPDPRIRTPFQWDETPTTAGFTRARRPYEPLASEFSARYTVASQAADPQSLLNHYRALIALRNRSEALRRGATIQLSSTDRSVYAILRRSQDETLLVLINLANTPTSSYALSTRRANLPSFRSAEVIFGTARAAAAPSITAGDIRDYIPLPELGAREVVVLRLRP
ncbi:MAG: alpha-amylase family glycosyl hydrolase [Anaerolineae bacterium]|nr:alpha-amylase family glycosyl hydrolase [Anaerolineae bacterium]